MERELTREAERELRSKALLAIGTARQRLQKAVSDDFLGWGSLWADDAAALLQLGQAIGRGDYAGIPEAIESVVANRVPEPWSRERWELVGPEGQKAIYALARSAAS